MVQHRSRHHETGFRSGGKPILRAARPLSPRLLDATAIQPLASLAGTGSGNAARLGATLMEPAPTDTSSCGRRRPSFPRRSPFQVTPRWRWAEPEISGGGGMQHRREVSLPSICPPEANWASPPRRIQSLPASQSRWLPRRIHAASRGQPLNVPARRNPRAFTVMWISRRAAPGVARRGCRTDVHDAQAPPRAASRCSRCLVALAIARHSRAIAWPGYREIMHPLAAQWRRASRC